jgi:5-formyltetrahydrofolate cyclo-ligase
MDPIASIVAKKAALREEALRRRDALPVDARAVAAEAIATRGLPVTVVRGSIVSGFMPIRSEINPIPLMRRCAEAGARLALPAILQRGTPLALRLWSVGERLVPGQWGIREPAPDAPEADPDIMLVPVVAFDRRGGRIGYGAGYYDMTIAGVRARKTVVALGVAYATQEVPEVPLLAHDVRLDLVLTERESIDCRGA